MRPSRHSAEIKGLMLSLRRTGVSPRAAGDEIDILGGNPYLFQPTRLVLFALGIVNGIILVGNCLDAPHDSEDSFSGIS